MPRAFGTRGNCNRQTDDGAVAAVRLPTTDASDVDESSSTGTEQRLSTPLPEGVNRSLLLRSLPQEDLTAVLGAGQLIQRSRGQRLLGAGVDAVLCLLSGAAKEHRASVHDEEAVLRLLFPGDVAGMPSALGVPADTDLTALADTRALVVSGRRLRRLARERPALALGWLQAAAEQISSLRHEALAFASTSTAQRVTHRLVELAERCGEHVGEEVRIRLQLTQEELASWAGASRESAAKTLHDLRRAGIVLTRRRSVTVLDFEALRRRLPEPPARPARETAPIDLTIAETDATAEPT